jgi:hypothetical protein
VTLSRDITIVAPLSKVRDTLGKSSHPHEGEDTLTKTSPQGLQGSCK